MQKEVLEQFYGMNYAADEKSEKIYTAKYRKITTDRYEACLKYFHHHFDKDYILEIGGGSGMMVNSFIKAGIDFKNYTVSDLSNVRLKSIINNINDPRVKTLQLDVENFDIKEIGTYDAIIMLALIEHLIDPISAMVNIKKLLKPGGFVYIETPNFPKYSRRIKLLFGYFPATASKNEGLTTYDNKPVQLIEEGHIKYFTFRSLSLMLKKRCGFKEVLKYPNFTGGRFLNKKINHFLAKLWPEMFSDLVVIAYA